MEKIVPCIISIGIGTIKNILKYLEVMEFPYNPEMV